MCRVGMESVCVLVFVCVCGVCICVCVSRGGGHMRGFHLQYTCKLL